MTEKLKRVIEEQKAYYQARAQEYDEWFYRQGRYDHGAEHTRQWETEAEVIRQALADFHLTGQVLDIASGTGIWTQELVKTADHVTALDSSEEMVELNRRRVQTDKVTYTLTDLFYWQPVMLYDAIFMGFWLSHVPPSLLYDFIGTIAGALKPGGKLFFVDSLGEPTSTAKDSVDSLVQNLAQREAAPDVHENSQSASPPVGDSASHSVRDSVITRRLNDGREFQIVKMFYLPDDLAERFKSYDIQLTIRQTDNFFLYGRGIKLKDEEK